jgi:hypothetical protein
VSPPLWSCTGNAQRDGCRGRSRAICNHGGLTPPALVAVRTFAGEKTIFAMHERTFTRAAGVSPPWCVIRTMCGKNGALFG